MNESELMTTTQDRLAFMLIHDPDNTWLQVHPTNLVEVGLKTSDLSAISKKVKAFFYLDEASGDAQKFLHAWVMKFNSSAPVKEVTTEFPMFKRGKVKVETPTGALGKRDI